MVTIKIIFVASDLKRIFSAIAKVRTATRTRAKNIGYQLGTDYLKLLHINILSQKYAGNYYHYNKKYEEWKRSRGSEDRFWILSGDLLGALTIWKKRFGWIAGIPAGVMDRGGKNYTGKGPPTYIGAYARILEYGGIFYEQIHPPRPVFRPTFEEYKASGAIKRVKESREIIRRNWR